jgi:hypothetical protein
MTGGYQLYVGFLQPVDNFENEPMLVLISWWSREDADSGRCPGFDKLAAKIGLKNMEIRDLGGRFFTVG